jgi:hypothetical protein
MNADHVNDEGILAGTQADLDRGISDMVGAVLSSSPEKMTTPIDIPLGKNRIIEFVFGWPQQRQIKTGKVRPIRAKHASSTTTGSASVEDDGGGPSSVGPCGGGGGGGGDGGDSTVSTTSTLSQTPPSSSTSPSPPKGTGGGKWKTAERKGVVAYKRAVDLVEAREHREARRAFMKSAEHFGNALSHAKVEVPSVVPTLRCEMDKALSAAEQIAGGIIPTFSPSRTGVATSLAPIFTSKDIDGRHRTHGRSPSPNP